MWIDGDYIIIANTLLMSDHERKIWDDLSPFFAPWELDSDDFSLYVSISALKGLNAIRAQYGRPIRCSSAYRTTAHNIRVKGSKKSQHLKGVAFDLITPKPCVQGPLFEYIAIEKGFTAIGRYPDQYFIHIDMRKPKRAGHIAYWGSKDWSMD